ncbi:MULTISPECIES: NAD-dependent epimerase/dehydratase family protein [unclassified Aureimonas]|uniref:NAD-dependent epimerase/dehydratase family protein n=1 Tax=unclassified Aureimonas TaxID=2615206 RepID=UPI0006F58381|nr:MULTISPECIES: NAD-dependent epimerase/dehydratase family protein [unclassified Aureimonas]KQT66032.1 NAD-dependent dehydratase [Aureimonas sp. Leaf427]KQT73390.1 NAD-dependent dehydratase [Aureimonas sp. Leaf460]
MKIIVLGGDGFCGWPTALHLSALGHEVTIVDNFVRRRTDEELGAGSLTPIRPLGERLEAWSATGHPAIGFAEIDVAEDYDALEALFRSIRPDTIVHFAEQRAAPYSMKSPRHKRYTVDNNVNATHAVLCAMVEACPGAHLVHLGTMGVYGYGKTKGMPIPEGYIDATLRSGGATADADILYPVDPGSIYHMTKTLDQLLFLFYAKNDGLAITDLHQGIVWGTATPQTLLDERLVNRFDYDGDYGTVLNRFLCQAAIGHPLTVHGTGGQTRAFIHIRDTVRCIEAAAATPPEWGSRVRIVNQMTETHRVRDLARLVSDLSGVPVEFRDNPRKEAPENDLVVVNDTLLHLGLRPTRLSDGLLTEVVDVARRHADRIDQSRIVSTSRWVRPPEDA